MSDGREGLPSASGLERLCLCPGSWQASKQCPPQDDTADSVRGTRLHEHMEKHTLPEDADEADACMWCTEMELALYDDIFFEREGAANSIREKRLFDAHLYFSGKADVVYVNGETALILDYKFGRGAVTSAPGNHQLAALAILVADNYPEVQVIYAGILQPYLSRKKPELARFDREQVENARRYFINAIKRAYAENPPLAPGAKQCRYCPCSAACPASGLVLTNSALTDFERWTLLTPQQRREWWDKWQLVKKKGEAIEKAIRKDLEKGVEIPGLFIADGTTKSEIVDPAGAFAFLAEELGVTPEEFTSCCKVSITPLDRIVHEKLKKRNPKQKVLESRNYLRTALGDCVQAKVTRGSIEEGGEA